MTVLDAYNAMRYNTGHDTVFRGTQDVFDGKDTKTARRACPRTLWRVAQRKLTTLHTANDLRDLRAPGNHLEALEDDRAGQWSVRINDQYRVCFRWDGNIATDVEITDYH